MAGFIGPGGNNCESDIVMKPVAAREIWLTVFHIVIIKLSGMRKG